MPVMDTGSVLPIISAMSPGIEPALPSEYYDYPQANPSSHVRHQHAQPVHEKNSHPTHLGGLPPSPLMGYYPNNGTSVMRPAYQQYMSAPAGFDQPPHPAQYHMDNTYYSHMTGPAYGYQDQHLDPPASVSEVWCSASEIYSKNDGWTGEWDADGAELRDGREDWNLRLVPIRVSLSA